MRPSEPRRKPSGRAHRIGVAVATSALGVLLAACGGEPTGIDGTVRSPSSAIGAGSAPDVVSRTIDLTARIGEGARATAINDSGVVVGELRATGPFASDGFVWDPENGLRTFGAQFRAVRPSATNNRNTVVGVLNEKMIDLPDDPFNSEPDSTLSPPLAFTWTPSAGIRFLNGTINPVDVNDRDRVLALPQGDAEFGFWSLSGGPLRTVPAPAGIDDLGLTAMNDRGTAVGFARPSGRSSRRAFRWTPGSGTELLPEGPFVNRSQAWDVGDRGMIAGFADRDGAVWGRDQSVREVAGGDLGAVVEFRAVNDSGQAVGELRFPEGGGSSHAVFWSEDTGLVDLTPDAHRARAIDINSRGQVLGFAVPVEGEDARHLIWEIADGETSVSLELGQQSFEPVLIQEFNALTQEPSDRDDRTRGTVRVERGGSAAEDVEVTLTAKSTDLGGHVGPHDPSEKPAGRFVMGGALRDSLVVTTDRDGRAEFTYQTSGLSGREAVIAAVGGQSEARDSVEIDIRAEGAPFPPIPQAPSVGGFPLYGFKDQSSHDGQVFFGRAGAVDLVVGIMEDFVTDFESRDQVFERGGRFVITDANLPLGGLNDADIPRFCGRDEQGGSHSCWQSPHQFHRTGRSFDLRTKNMAADLARRLDRLCSRSPETRFCDLEFPGTPSEHLHVETR